MNRRNFITKTAAASSVAAIGSFAYTGTLANSAKPSNAAKFKLNYAPGLGMFSESAGNDPIDAIKFCSDQGFTAVFDNGLMGKTPELQEKIAAELSRRNMAMGPFVLYADFKVESMVLKDPVIREMLINKVKDGVEVCKRTGFKQALMVPGRFNLNLAWDYQTANVIDIMRELSEIAEKGG
jgi:hydroxypyruvate isomerase